MNPAISGVFYCLLNSLAVPLKLALLSHLDKIEGKPLFYSAVFS